MSADSASAPDLAPGIAAFLGWANAQARSIGRPLTRSDLTLGEVARWAANLKIIDRDAASGDLLVRLFGTAMVEIYGRDLTGQVLQEALPASVAARLLGGYARAADGSVVHEAIRFDWGNGKIVAYERLIYPLVEGGTYSKFAVVGFRMRGERQFLMIRDGICNVATETRVLAQIG